MDNLGLIESCSTLRVGFQPWGDELTWPLAHKIVLVEYIEELGVHHTDGSWPYSIPVLSGNLIESGFLMAMILCMVTFVIPAFSRELRGKKSILLSYWFVIVLHQIIAFTNACFYQCWIARSDANGFHSAARELAMNGEWHYSVGDKFYVNVLAVAYRWFGPSHLLGEQLSILFFALSCLILLAIIRQLGLGRYRLFSLVIFGMLPSMVFYSSITVRESYQLFFFMLAVFCGLKMLMREGNSYLIALTLSATMMGFFHRALNLYAFCLVLLFAVWIFWPSVCLDNIKRLRLGAGIVVLIFLAVLGALSRENFLSYNEFSGLIDSVLEAVTAHRNNSMANMGKTGYGIPLDFSSLAMAFYSSFKVYAHYLFGPFPWKIRGMSDAYAAIESTLRMILIYFSVKHWGNAYGSQRRLLGMMLTLYFSMTLMWSLGTTNYGTAVRHHLLSGWILIIIGVPPMLKSLRVKWDMVSCRLIRSDER